jgi:hypothetical protein
MTRTTLEATFSRGCSSTGNYTVFTRLGGSGLKLAIIVLRAAASAGNIGHKQTETAACVCSLLPGAPEHLQHQL